MSLFELHVFIFLHSETAHGFFSDVAHDTLIKRAPREAIRNSLVNPCYSYAPRLTRGSTIYFSLSFLITQTFHDFNGKKDRKVETFIGG